MKRIKESEKKEKYGKIISTYQYHYIPMCIYFILPLHTISTQIYSSISTIIIHLIWENKLDISGTFLVYIIQFVYMLICF